MHMPSAQKTKKRKEMTTNKRGELITSVRFQKEIEKLIGQATTGSLSQQTFLIYNLHPSRTSIPTTQAQQQIEKINNG